GDAFVRCLEGAARSVHPDEHGEPSKVHHVGHTPISPVDFRRTEVDLRRPEFNPGAPAGLRLRGGHCYPSDPDQDECCKPHKPRTLPPCCRLTRCHFLLPSGTAPAPGRSRLALITAPTPTPRGAP